MTSRQSILIVGAGVFGVTAARELARRGHEVTLLDPGPIPNADAASCDISKLVRSDYGADRFYTLLMRKALPLWREWNEGFGQTLFHEDGILFLAKRPLKPGGFEYESMELQREVGSPVVPLDAGGIAAHYTSWSGQAWSAGYFNPQAGWVSATRTMKILLADARLSGVQILEGARMQSLIQAEDRVLGVHLDQGDDLRADLTLVAAGAWTPALLPHLDGLLQVVGQPVVHLQVDDPEHWQSPGFPAWAADISRTGWYGFPALDDGTLKIGNHGPGRPMDPSDAREVTAEDLRRVRWFLNACFDSLGHARVVSSRMCLYCDSVDGDFWIDHDPHRPGLMVAAGGSGHAFKFAPVLGPIIADVAEGRVTHLTTRFAWRERPHNFREGSRSLKQGV